MTKKKPKSFEDVPMLDVPAVEPPEKRATRLKESWKPTPDQMAKARAAFPTVDLDDELERFMDYHLAKGSKMVDWYRALRTWLNNAKKWQEKDRRSPRHSGFPGRPVQAQAPVYNPAEQMKNSEPW